MKKLLLAVLIVLAACAPGVTRSPEVVYAAPMGRVYAEVVKSVSTAEPLRLSRGWIITQSDRAGGFLAATSQSVTILGVPNGYSESISVVVSGKGEGQTAVVIQGTGGAGPLMYELQADLGAAFGEPQSAF